MIEELLHLASDPAAEPDFGSWLRNMCGRWRPRDAPTTEDSLNGPRTPSGRNPRRVRVRLLGLATLTAEGSSWCAGRFDTPSIGELQARTSANGGTARLWVFDGASPATDIGALQATGGGGRCFRSPPSSTVSSRPGRASFRLRTTSPTQRRGRGRRSRRSRPRSSGTIPPLGRDGRRFVQRTGGPQIDLLADVFGPGNSPVRQRLLTTTAAWASQSAAMSLEAAVRPHPGRDPRRGRGRARIQWHGAVANADERRISQCFTSTVAGSYGGKSAPGARFEPVCQQYSSRLS